MWRGDRGAGDSAASEEVRAGQWRRTGEKAVVSLLLRVEAWEVVCPVQEIIDSSSGKWEEEGAARVSREGRTCVWARELDREEEARCGGWLQ